MQLSLFATRPVSVDRTFARARRIPLGAPSPPPMHDSGAKRQATAAAFVGPEATRSAPRAASAWVEWVPGWLQGDGQLFDRLRRTADWEQHGRQMYDRYVTVPRLVAACPGHGAPLGLPQEDLLRIARATASADEIARVRGQLRRFGRVLGARYGRPLPAISLAYYRDGSDSVAFHGDRLGPRRKDSVVAILSLGGARRFQLRPRRPNGVTADRLDPPPEPLQFRVGAGDLLVMGGDCQDSWEHGVPKQAHGDPRIAVMFRETGPVTKAATEAGSRPGQGARGATG